MLQNLRQLTQEDVWLENCLARLIETPAKLKSFIEPIQAILTKLGGVPSVLEYRRFSLEKTVSVTGTLFLGTWPSRAGNFWIEVDTKVAQDLVYRVLAQNDDAAQRDPRLSDLERGIMLYVLAQVFEVTQDSFQLSREETQPTAPLLSISLDWKFGDIQSFVRLWVSKELFESMLETPSAEQVTSRTQARTSWFQVPARVELARFELTPEQLKGLEAGDIILLEEAALKLQEKSLSGPAKIHIGQPSIGTLTGNLSVAESGKYAFSVSEISAVKEP